MNTNTMSENENIKDVCEISKISFGILSPEEILKMSTCEVTSVKVSDKGENIYSKFMGTIENGENCKSCDKDVWECAGHFGHFKLEVPVVNPIFVNDVANILKCICFECYKFVLTRDHLKFENLIHRFSDILLWIKNVKYCYWCETEKTPISVVNETIVDEHKNPIDVYKILRVLENMDFETVEFLGFNPTMAHPKNYIFTIFPVLPPCCRPYVMSDENCCDDDLTYQLTEIIKNNQYLSEEYLNKAELKRKKSVLQSSILPTAEIQQKHLTNLKFRISTYFNNSKKKAKHAATARPITGLKERIAGKEGQIRNNLLGKRCDQSGRTVVGPDTTLKLDELIVPKEMAETLTIPEFVTPFNIGHLTNLVNTGKVNFLIKNNDPKRSINLKNALNYRGELLYFGDIVVRHGQEIKITDTKFALVPHDQIIRNGKMLKNVKYPETKQIELQIGDLVKRQLMDGDYVLLNRQPTLHKASMMSLKVIIKPVKTLKVNLAITKPFNCDFDGDEMNIHVPQSYEAISELKELSLSTKQIMSVQNGRPNMAIVQDSLIGAFIMSKDGWKQSMDNSQYYDLLMAIQDNNLNVDQRMREIENVLLNQSVDPRSNESSGVLKGLNVEPSVKCGKGVLSFLFPSDFDYTDPKHDLEIEQGVLKQGVLEKRLIGSLIKILYKDYGETTVYNFINNIQFITNKFLVEQGFTINASDCLKNHEAAIDIQNTLESTWIKAEAVQKVTKNSFIAEQKLMQTLNSCTDQCMRKSKDALSPHNNFKTAEESGSKGSIFNICQITSLLGQQTIDGKRVAGLVHPQENEFKNRGFICNSFVEGLSPREFFHHAMAGRKGVIDTALLTSVSGYGQRQGVKLNEDIKVYPDYTVRDINGRMYQYIFGEVGYDPSQTIVVDGVPTILNVYRLSKRLNSRCVSTEMMRQLTDEEIEFMVDYVQKRSHLPKDVEETIFHNRRRPIIKQLRNIYCYPNILPELKSRLEMAFYSTLMSPGECVGILGAQSMGEFSTQATLNTFHIAGSTTTGAVTNCLTRFQEINNATKNPKNVIGKIYFKTSNTTIEEIRLKGQTIRQFMFRDLVEKHTIVELGQSPLCRREWWYCLFAKVYDLDFDNIFQKNKRMIRCILKKDIIYTHKLHPELIKTTLETKHSVIVVFSPESEGLIMDIFCEDKTTVASLDVYFSQILCVQHIIGLEGVKNIHYLKDDSMNVWYIQTEGGNLKDFYTLDDVDVENTTTNNIWDIYNTLGIEAAREFRIKELTEIMGSGVDISHIKLRADRLTFTGTIQSLTRYTMRGEKPFSKVGFEEIMENFYKTARDAEIDDLTGVSASIMCGKRAKVGTSMFDLKLDVDKILGWDNLFDTTKNTADDDDDEQFIDYDYYD